MAKLSTSSGHRCYHCGSAELTKAGKFAGKQRYACKACGRKSQENALYRRDDYWRKGCGVRCYHCGSMETRKAGFSRFGKREKQKYHCRGCNRHFRENLEVGPATGGNFNFWVRKNLPSASHLILELKALAQSLGRTPRVYDIAERSKKGLGNSVNTFTAVFGGFREALRRAKLTPDYPRVYPPEKMIAELRQLRKKLGRAPQKADIRRAFEKGKAPSIYFLKRAFGSMTNALKAAEVGRKIYTEAEMIDFLRKLDATLDRRVMIADIRESYRRGEGPSETAVMRMFGNLTNALRSARVMRRSMYSSVTFNPRRPSRSDEQLLADLKMLGEKIGRRPTLEDIDQASKEGLCARHFTYQKRFGGILEACRLAGFPEASLVRQYKTPVAYADEEIIAALKQLTKKLGRFPTYSQLRTASREGKCPNEKTIVARLADIRRLLNGKD